jgi:hypothetical protein
MSLYVYNPFLRSSSQPKLQDGRMDRSIGLQNRIVRHTEVVTLPTNTKQIIEENYSYVTAIVMLPSINAPVSVYSGTIGDPITLKKLDSFNQELSLYDNIAQLDDKGNGTVEAIGPLNWRVVSQGLRIVITSSETETDGFFETISVPTSMSIDDCTGKLDDDIQTEISGVTMSPDYVMRIYGNRVEWRDQQTYKAGPLNEMNGLQFRQLPDTNDHGVVRLLRKYETPMTTQLIEGLLDPSFQTRITFLYTASKVRFTLVSNLNLEMQYPPTSNIKQFETQNEAENVAQAIAQGAVASTMEALQRSTEAVGGVMSVTNEIPASIRNLNLELEDTVLMNSNMMSKNGEWGVDPSQRQEFKNFIMKYGRHGGRARSRHARR